MFNENNLEDVFNNLFGGGNQNKNAESANLRKCDVCEGKGGRTEEPPAPCAVCNGSGAVITEEKSAFGVMKRKIMCETCYGHGYQIIEPCGKCHGRGVVEP